MFATVVVKIKQGDLGNMVSPPGGGNRIDDLLSFFLSGGLNATIQVGMALFTIFLALKFNSMVRNVTTQPA